MQGLPYKNSLCRKVYVLTQSNLLLGNLNVRSRNISEEQAAGEVSPSRRHEEVEGMGQKGQWWESGEGAKLKSREGDVESEMRGLPEIL